MHTFACVRANKAKWHSKKTATTTETQHKKMERKSNEKNN